jgi:predicted dehydrogenase
VPVTSAEPLKRELEDFVEAIRQQRAPAVTGEDGRRALALAQEISHRMVLTTNDAAGPHFSAAGDRRD